MATVGIVMGSDSDMPVMAKAAEMLDRFGIDYEMKIISAHREPDIFFEWAKGAKERGTKGDHRRSRKSSTSSGNVCSSVSNAGHRNPNENVRFRRSRFLIFYRTDAKWYSGCNSSDQWRTECRNPCSKDPCNF